MVAVLASRLPRLLSSNSVVQVCVLVLFCLYDLSALQISRPSRSFRDPIPLELHPASGAYYMTIHVGPVDEETPFRVHIDTGSSDFGLHSPGCLKCRPGATHAYTHVGARSVHCRDNDHLSCACRADMACGMSVEFEDDSGFKGVLYRDRVLFGARSANVSTTSNVAAIYEQSDRNFQPHVIDGVMGFAYARASASQSRTPFERLVEDGLVEDEFAMCLHEAGGRMYLGSSATAAFDRVASITGETAQWVTQAHDDFYTVRLLDIKVDGVSIGVPASVYNRGEAIIDSGSTSIILPAKAFQSLRTAFLVLCSKGAALPGLCSRGSTVHHHLHNRTIFDGDLPCFSMRDEQLRELPVLQLQFSDGVELELQPWQYLQSTKEFCPGVKSEGSRYALAIEEGNDPGTTLGTAFMQAFTTLFDRSSKRIGFIKTPRSLCE